MEIYRALQFWSLKEWMHVIELPEQEISLMQGILPYVQEFLCSPHPFRRGPVCPFVPAAIKKDQIFFTYINPDQLRTDQLKTSMNLIQECISYYQENRKSNAAMILLFPQNFDIRMLLAIHLYNKIFCVKNELMLGALWDKNQAKSLHSELFFPLRTPSPILVIRDLTPHDLIFLDPKHYSVHSRLTFLKAYIQKFSNDRVPQSESRYLADAIELKNHYRKTLRWRWGICGIGFMTICFILLRIIVNAN